ncbi:MAG: ROK family protein [Pseudomonadota bacterium]
MPKPNYIIAMDMGGTNIRAAILNNKKIFLAKASVPSEARLGNEKIMENIIGLKNALLKKVNLYDKDLLSLNLGIPGSILFESGVVVESPHVPSWKNYPFKKILEKRTNIKVKIDNDANCITLGEFKHSRNSQSKNLCCLTLGTGVGGGIIINGKLYRGSCGTAGELGHITINPKGPSCNCGNNGCLESYCSSFGLINIIKEVNKALIKKVVCKDGYADSKILYALANQNNKDAIEIFKLFGTYLGIGLADIVDALNPDKIIIAGGISNSWKFFHTFAKDEMKKRAFATPANHVKILKRKLSENGGIIGASYL